MISLDSTKLDISRRLSQPKTLPMPLRFTRPLSSPRRIRLGTESTTMQAVHGDLTLVPTASAFDALKRDYQRMTEDGLLFDEAESFETLMSRCATIQALVKASRAK